MIHFSLSTKYKIYTKKLNEIFFHISNYNNMYGGSIYLNAYVNVHHNFGKKQKM
jgi:hypothetical protein